MAPRRRPPRQMVGNTRMDAALDAMRQLGFEKILIRETVDELLDVYEGTQGWIFIEEASYKLLIETILGKQQSSAEEKDDARRDGIPETSSAATPTAGITEVGSSGLVAQDSVLHASDDLDSASQTNDHHHDSSPLGNLETDVKDTTASTGREGHGQGIRVGSKIEHQLMDNVKGSNDKAFVSNAENTTTVRSSMIESSKARENRSPSRRRRPYHGWISHDSEVDLIYFPLPPLPERIEKLIGKSEASQRRRRKSRWDEKPDDM